VFLVWYPWFGRKFAAFFVNQYSVIVFISQKSEAHVNNTKFAFYLTENTLGLHYKDQLVNAVREVAENNTRPINTLSGLGTELLMLKQMLHSLRFKWLKLNCENYIVTWLNNYRRGFGLVTGFIGHINTKLVTTRNCSAIVNSHILQFTTARTKPFQSAVSWPVVAW
jgi:hypothetical protein